LYSYNKFYISDNNIYLGAFYIIGGDTPANVLDLADRVE